jgi:hypothetical protein
MSERKPEGMRFESWVERQIREAQERGAFDNLPGAGRPLPGLTGNYDDMWWIKQLVQRERLSFVPPMLALRKEAEELLAGLADVPTKTAVRDLVKDYNARVIAEIRRPQVGRLPVIPRRLDVDQVVEEWARRRAARTSNSIVQRPTSAEIEPRPRQRPWWRRLWPPGSQADIASG